MDATQGAVSPGNRTRSFLETWGFYTKGCYEICVPNGANSTGIQVSAIGTCADAFVAVKEIVYEKDEYILRSESIMR